jgi:long-chain acyl-CoA synthetase
MAIRRVLSRRVLSRAIVDSSTEQDSALATLSERYPTIVEFFEASADKYPERVALKTPVAGGADYLGVTYRELNELADRCAAGLRARGIRKGDKVALLSRPRVEWAAAMLGVLKLGAIVVPLDPLLGRQEIQRLLTATDATAVVAAGSHIEFVQASVSLDFIVSMDPGSVQDLVPWETFIQEIDAEASRMTVVRPDDLAFFMCTSGTTGDAKAVMLAHQNFSANLTAVFERLDINSEDVVLTIAPWNHIMGLIILMATLWQGAQMIYTDEYKNLPTLLKGNRATVLTAVPKLYHAMFAKVESTLYAKPLNRWLYRHMPRLVGWSLQRKLAGKQFRFFVSGSAPLAPEVAAGFRRLGLGMIQGYGMTETSPVLTFSTPLNDKAASVGPPLSNVEMQIAEPNEEGVGEIVVRGPNVMRGYYKNLRRTRQILLADGWLRTGDLGSMDQADWLTIRGRSKNVIVLETGKNVYPEEIEWELAASPYIEEVLVKAGHRQGLEVICAYIYPKWDVIGSTATPQEVKHLIWEEIKRTSRNLAHYKRIKSEHDIFIVGQPFQKTSKLDIKRHLYQERKLELI